MQGDIFGNPEVPGDRPFVNQNSKMLKCTVGDYAEVLARSGSMVAYQGQIDFDYELMSMGQAQRQILTGERLSLMRCSGQGDLFLAEKAQDIHIIELEGGISSGGIVVQDCLAGIVGLLRYNVSNQVRQRPGRTA